MAYWIQRYKVTGVGHFPLDMLRYDGSYPANGDAVGDISASHREGNLHEEFTIALVSHGLSKASKFFEPDRWRSFGWIVTSSEQPRKVD